MNHKHLSFTLLIVCTTMTVPIATSAKSSFENRWPGDNQCGQITVDCNTHKISIRCENRPINCGKNGTTITGRGTVGGRHSGKVVPDGVEINTPRMGQAGGGKVFHTPNPKAMSGTPTGVDKTKGCIAVDLQTLNMLKNCTRAPLEIIGTDGGRGRPLQQMADSSGGTSPASDSQGAR